MEHQIINLIIAVNGGPSIFRLGFFVAEELKHLVDVRDLSDGFFGVHVDGCGLGCTDCAEGADLAVVETRGFAKI